MSSCAVALRAIPASWPVAPCACRKHCVSDEAAAGAQGGLAVNALGNAEILQYPKYKLNLYVVAVCFVAASGGLLFGARCCFFPLAHRLASCHAQRACCLFLALRRPSMLTVDFAGYEIFGVTGGVTTSSDFLALFFPDVHQHVAVEHAGTDSAYCKVHLSKQTPAE